MDDRPPAPSRRLLFWVGLSALGLFCVVVAAGTESARRGWEKVEAQTSELMGQVMGLPTASALPPDTTNPASAWDAYQTALRARSLDDALSALARGAAATDRSWRYFGHSARGGGRLDQALDELRLPDVIECVEFAERVAGELLVRAGKPDQAPAVLDSAMDLVRFGVDLTNVGALVTVHTGRAVIEQGLDVLSKTAADKLPAAAWAEMARTLAELERDVPELARWVDFWEVDVRLGAVALGSVNRSDAAGAVLSAVSRPLLQIALADAVEMAEIVRGVDGLPWPECKSELDRAAEVLAPGLLVDSVHSLFVHPSVLSLPRLRRELIARLRVAQIRAHWCATDDLLQLPDPFGGEFEREKESPNGAVIRGTVVSEISETLHKSAPQNCAKKPSFQ